MADQDENNTRVLEDKTVQRVGEYTETHVLTRSSLARDALRPHGRVRRNGFTPLAQRGTGEARIARDRG